MQLNPKKSLGQHFLRSEKALNQIVGNITTDPQGSVVFEIGPGEGVLTEKILESGYTVFAIEIDKEAIFLLKQKFKDEIQNKKLIILEKDCLEVDYVSILKQYKFENYFLLGNIPYYITGAIFRHTFEQNLLPTGVIFLIQKEVATRIVASDKKESILSISVKIFGTPKIIDIVKAGSFVPPPKVDSAILKISNIQNPFKNKKGYENFFSILKSAFHHKRKFALSNIKNELGEDAKVSMQKFFKEKDRAEDVSVEIWKEIIISQCQPN